MPHDSYIQRLYVKHTKDKGRGVYTTEGIRKDEMIEISPLLILPPEAAMDIQKTPLSHYIYEYHEGCDALALGYGSMYNHSYTPNAFYQFDIENQTSEFIALRNISAHEEITINYNGDPKNHSELWFSVKA